MARMPSPNPRARRRVGRAVALLAPLLAVLVAPPAAAHSILVGSAPAPGDTVAALTEVRLDFAAQLAGDGHLVTVVTAAGELDAAGYELPEASSLVARFDADVPDGEHEIVFDVVSGDGHHERGRIPVTVAATAGAPPATEAAGDGTAGVGTAGDGTDLPAAALVVAGVVVLAGAGAALAYRSRRGTARS